DDPMAETMSNQNNVDCFLKIEGIKPAESQDKEFRGTDGWMQIKGYRFSETQSGKMAFGGGGGAGKGYMEAFQFTKTVDAVSPKLFLYSATSQEFKSATVVVRGKRGKQDTVTWTLTPCRVARYSQTGNAAGSPLPVETIQLAFAYVKETHGQVQGSFDLL